MQLSIFMTRFQSYTPRSSFPNIIQPSILNPSPSPSKIGQQDPRSHCCRCVSGGHRKYFSASFRIIPHGNYGQWVLCFLVIWGLVFYSKSRPASVGNERSGHAKTIWGSFHVCNWCFCGRGWSRQYLGTTVGERMVREAQHHHHSSHNNHNNHNNTNHYSKLW